MKFGFVGPSYTPYSSSADSERTVNLYPEQIESGKGKSEIVLYGTPGLSLLLRLINVAIVGGGAGYTVNDILTVVGGAGAAATLIVTSVAAGVINGISVNSSGAYTTDPGDPVSVTGGTGAGATFTLNFATAVMALFYETVSKRIFAITRLKNSTIRLFEITLAGVQTDRGQLSATVGTLQPASMSANGLQVLIVVPEKTVAFIFTLATNVLTNVTASVGNTFPLWGQFLDQYFIALCTDGQIYISKLLDGTVWTALDTAKAESSPDLTTMIITDHGEIRQFGPESLETWYNSGAADFPFQPLRGATIPRGILYRYSAVALDNKLYWVSRGLAGKEQVWEADGYSPRRISNHAVENSLQTKTVSGALPVAWAYQEGGHNFYILTFPDDSLTWVYDVATKMWHERTYLSSTANKATGILTGTAAFVNGEQITIGTVTYTMRTALSAPAVANEILIGVNLAASLDNMKLAVNAGAGVGVNYSTGTVAHPTVTATTNTDTQQTVEAIAAGGSGDDIITTETAMNASWANPTLTGGFAEQSHRGRCQCFAGREDGAADAQLIGDRANGKIFKMALAYLNDGGDSIRRERRAQHLSNEQKRNFFSGLQLEIEAAAGTFTLDYSNDGGSTFNAPLTGRANYGNAGRAWNRLGSARDRVYRVRSLASIKHAWIDAYLEMEPGAH